MVASLPLPPRRVLWAASIAFTVILFLALDVYNTGHLFSQVDWAKSKLPKNPSSVVHEGVASQSQHDIPRPTKDAGPHSSAGDMSHGTSTAVSAVHSNESLISNIFNNTLGFEKIFVVGLPDRTDRRDGMVLQAALSNMEIEFIDGVRGENVPTKAVPAVKDGTPLKSGTIGAWRAHMNAIQEVVHRNLTSALIMEDDIDWDIRIKQQLYDFALGVHALTQPLADGSGKYADPTYKKLKGPQKIVELQFIQLPETVPPALNPYGDDWDVLWVGHCGNELVSESNEKVMGKGRVIRSDDETVQGGYKLDDYPEHTRAIHHVQGGVCSLAYAVSRTGAQKLLFETGLKPVDTAFDLLLNFYCNSGPGRKAHNCLAVRPTLFAHHRPVGSTSAQSDIDPHGGGYVDKASTDGIRWSVRLNAEALMEDRDDYVDQYPEKKMLRE